MLLACKEFHLARKMLLLNALWQLVTILRTWLMASHTQPFKDQSRRDQGCE
jgi:hypothetical protein